MSKWKDEKINFKYNYGVFMGRFQILHNGHMHVIMEALKQAEHLIIPIGSINQPRSPRNPFTYKERTEHIYGALPEEYWDSVTVIGIEDMLYNDSEWITQVRSKVQEVIDKREGKQKVCLFGHSKDETSYYLELFPAWNSRSISNYKGLSSTPLRDTYFYPDNHKNSKFLVDSFKENVPLNVIDFLKVFRKTEDYRWVVKEQTFVDKYKESWASAPYPPIFVTVNAVVIVGGHILLIKRRAEPGAGLYALPGGFINPKELIQNAVIRELREETRIKVPVPVLNGSIVSKDVFDSPNRSARGRTITHTFLIHLKNERSLPKIAGGDDANKAVWVPLDTLDSSILFEDHASIIRKMIKDV
ncbi:MAG: bifunctional nicotinamide-nucleotide adenylyltransferase/Nudix hydroxylase [Proteobacteria bacterium]|nr:bifunctional nicotinamide-nucleotide adenylyltransferase/Nudix hydroxylase [Pseudomonadota bacterium]